MHQWTVHVTASASARPPRGSARAPRGLRELSITPVKAQETFWPVPAQPGLELGLQIAVELAIGLGPVRPQIAVELAMSF